MSHVAHTAQGQFHGALLSGQFEGGGIAGMSAEEADAVVLMLAPVEESLFFQGDTTLAEGHVPCGSLELERLAVVAGCSRLRACSTAEAYEARPVGRQHDGAVVGCGGVVDGMVDCGGAILTAELRCERLFAVGLVAQEINIAARVLTVHESDAFGQDSVLRSAVECSLRVWLVDDEHPLSAQFIDACLRFSRH